MRMTRFHLETVDERDELRGFRPQRMRRRRCLLHHRGIVLRRLIDLRNRGIDLGKTGGLFGRGRCNAADKLIDMDDLLNRRLQRLARLADQMDALIDLIRQFVDDALDLLRRFGGALREAAHF